jgi:hypothetical protein
MMKELAREYPPPTISNRSEILAPGTSEVLIITNTPKEAERRIDPIDSSIRSHQDERNNGIIDLIDSASDYLPDQLKFFFN